MTAQSAAPPGAAPAGGPNAHHEARSPAEEALDAIEDARRLLDEAAGAVATGDDEKIAHAYEIAASCTDHFARALWYLRRVERERQAPA